MNFKAVVTFSFLSVMSIQNVNGSVGAEESGIDRTQSGKSIYEQMREQYRNPDNPYFNYINKNCPELSLENLLNLIENGDKIEVNGHKGFAYPYGKRMWFIPDMRMNESIEPFLVEGAEIFANQISESPVRYGENAVRTCIFDIVDFSIPEDKFNELGTYDFPVVLLSKGPESLAVMADKVLRKHPEADPEGLRTVFEGEINHDVREVEEEPQSEDSTSEPSSGEGPRE
ncbi:MAG: hypothetical protein GY915_05880 [bacterium]|nr:hypothetical protein [bacterium]